MKKMLMVLLAVCLMLCAGSAMAESVSYIERSWNNSLKTVVGATNTLTDGSYTLVTAETTTWENGKWYVARDDVTIGERVTVNGTVHLILCDDASLTVNGGIKVGTGKTLVIYGQSGGTGALTASSTYDAGIGGGQGNNGNGGAGGTVTVHGGVIHASSDHGAGVGGGQGNNGNGGAGGTVTVYGGVIHASSTYGAGIGGGQGSNGNGGAGGTVTVYGGEVHASSDHGAGIGGGYGYKGAGGAGGTVTVYGGEVHASSSDYGAGIGGGYGYMGAGGAGGAGGNVTIKGGVVYASGYDGAGIGGGSAYEERQTGGAGGNVTIEGGTVYATGSHYGAGIGGGGGRRAYGIGGDGGNVTISGGTVYATGGNYGAGIGGGGGYDYGSNSYPGKPGAGGTVMISGGVVYATGSKGAGIGGGCVTETSGGQGTGGTVKISGGTVYAASRQGINYGTSYGGFGIGAGYYRRTDKDSIKPVNKSITIAPPSGKAIVVKQSVKDAELDAATPKTYPPNDSIDADDRNKVFYAYTCDANNTGTYCLEFVANGGTGTMYPLRLPKGQATSLPSCGFTRTGYTFTGWNTQADGSGTPYELGELYNLQPGDNGKVVTLHAQWRPNTYTVRFRDNSGTVTMDDLACTYDQEITLPGNTFTRPGYTFKGWSVGGELLPESVTNLTAEDGGVVRLYAEWTANTYTVRFDKNAGDATGTMADQVLTYDGYNQQLSSNRFRRAGYTFDGWNTQENGKGKDYTGTEMPPNVTTVNGGVVTLYAQWKPNTYTVEFNANYGTGEMDSQEFTYDDEEQALTENAYTRINYFFAGWNTEEDGSGAAYADGAQTPNVTAENGVTVTLYAQWRALPIEGNDDVETQLLNEALTAEHLSGMPQGYNTLADVEAQMRGAAAQMGFLNGAQDGFIELRDVRLQQREKADGAYWIDVPKENFPAAGLTVTLEIPEGADVLTHDFLVVHMFTQEMDGRLPGAMEAFTPAIGEDGLTVTLNGCSPVGILWRVKPVDASALPQTGDPSSLLGWVCLLAMCAGAALVMKRARA